ncbi:cytochrome c oxidase subunit II [Rhodohalobacter halophilus]|uniref:cytochrome c oxidase subunit II n=1 Tax=Rhodohalobacter halophilus TaxID=1812810 RepID=UPI00083FA335|nr:cytochrome c oxidase subunit II [Rhodohalobacter halophilus]
MNRLIEYMLPPAKSTLAGETDALFAFINISSFIFIIGITLTMLYFAWRYRRKSDDDVTPVISHNNILEITWSVIPLILVIIVFSWGYSTYMKKISPPSDAYEVRVVGKSWLWEFHYDNGNVSVNELHVPENRPVKLIMSSDDVIHSFYVPDFRVKMDVLPNRYTSVWFEATEQGESTVYCTEYCGTAHSNMLATVHVHSQEDFEDWLETSGGSGEDLPPVERGEMLVQQNACMTCHSTDGSRLTGPTFQGAWGSDVPLENGETVQFDENYVRESILEPNAKVHQGFQPVMPSYAGTLDDRQIDAIIEYIKTLQ